MIIYGSRMYFKSNVVHSVGECEYCGTYGNQVSYQARKFGHLYFIPILPLGAKSQILNECKGCQRGAHIPLDALDPVVDSLTEQFKSWIMEIQEGNTKIVTEEGDDPVNVGILIAGILENLYCLKEIENIDSISEILNSNNLQFENAIVQGRWHEIQGDLVQAKRSYESAHQIKPDDPIPLYQLGMTAVNQGDAASAESNFKKYLVLCPDDISVYVQLATLYETQKNHSKIIEAYDQLYTAHPDFLADKAMKKIYKKACKKSGEPGRFLDQF